MLEKYLNKTVIIEEKMFGSSGHGSMSNAIRNKIEGIITAIDDEFIELDNNQLISRKFIYRIILK